MDTEQTSEGAGPERDDNAVMFESMGLRVGTRLQVTFTRAGVPVHYFTPVIGYVLGEYVLLKTPLDNRSAIAASEGEQVSVRVFSGLDVFTFTSAIAHVSRYPFFTLHLTFPDAIRVNTLRKAIRVKVSLDVTITSAADKSATPITARISNLSVTGALIESEAPIGEPNDTIKLAFSFLAQPGDYKVEVDTDATIRSVSSPSVGNRKDSGNVYGVEFSELSPDQRVMLQNVIYESLVGGRQTIA